MEKKTQEMTQARTLALQWVWRLQFNLNFEELWMLRPATVQALIEMLREENKDPMEWSEQECEEFVLEVSRSGAPDLPPLSVHFLQNSAV